MNALDVAQGKPLHKDTKLLAMFKADGLHTRHLLDREYTQGHEESRSNQGKKKIVETTALDHYCQPV